MRIILLLLVFTSCSLADFDSNIIEKDTHVQYQIEHIDTEYSQGDLLEHIETGLVVKFNCKINEYYFKGYIVDNGVLCEGYAGEFEYFKVCHDCNNKCN